MAAPYASTLALTVLLAPVPCVSDPGVHLPYVPASISPFAVTSCRVGALPIDIAAILFWIP